MKTYFLIERFKQMIPQRLFVRKSNKESLRLKKKENVCVCVGVSACVRERERECACVHDESKRSVL